MMTEITLKLKDGKLNEYSSEEIVQFMENSLKVIDDWVVKTKTWSVKQITSDDIEAIIVEKEE